MIKSLYRLFFIAGVLFLPAVPAQAQHPIEEPEKETIIIDYFSRMREVPPFYMEAVRSGVLDGFIKRGRHKVVDARTIRNLQDYAPEMVSGPSAFINGRREEQKRRSSAIRSLGARYMISGAVMACSFQREKPGERKEFTTDIVFALTGYDLLTGEATATEEFRATGSGDTPEKSDRSALESVSRQVFYYVDNHYKFRTEILQMEAPNARGKYKELYIRSGSSMGVQNGDLFRVYEQYDIAGEKALRPIGKIRAREVCGERVTRCSISSGGEAIAKAFHAGHILVVVSDGQALF